MFSRKAVLALLAAAVVNAATLTEAVKSGNRETIRTLLKQKVDVNAADGEGATPLIWAAQADDLETVQLLLNAGAKANVASRNGVTPLHFAAMNRDPAMAAALLKAGADANAKLPEGETILMTASRTGPADLVQQLLSHDARVGDKGPQFGETALMIAADENQADVVRALIEHGADVNGRTNAMQYSKDRFGLEGVLTILPHGSWTPLMYAARQGSLEAAKALVEAGAKLDDVDPDATSALLYAITNRHFDTAAYLVEKGADANLSDSAGMGPLYAAVDMNTLGEVYGQPPRPSHDKLSAQDLMKVLFAHGANPNAQLKGAQLQRAHTPGEGTLGAGTTPLMRAAKNGDASTIELLIANGATVDLAAKNKTTALMFAAGLGRGVGTFAKDYATDAQMIDAAKALVAHGADVNAVSQAGQTPILFASQAADTNLPVPSDEMILFLVAHGAKLDAKDNQGRTVLDMAQGKGLRGRAGGPVSPREKTLALLQQLLKEKSN